MLVKLLKMTDNNDEHISRSTSISRISAAYQSMYAKPEPEVNEEEIETKSEEDTDATTT
jgi:hypothetical protein|tara:strand:+ start:1015 stop:1191 length:177 start_codon:yes stop_codon:yes gene_type:complete